MDKAQALQFFEQVKKDLKEGVKNKAHSFHYFTLATTGINQVPRLRTVVLRNVNKELTLSIFTDRRSRKVTHIKEHNKVCVLFYCPKRLIQVKIDAFAYMERDPKVLQKIWDKMADDSKKDYITLKEPGEKIPEPSKLEYLDTSQNFSVMHMDPYKVEFLQLKRPDHLRIQFSLNERGTWDSSFLVP